MKAILQWISILHIIILPNLLSMILIDTIVRFQHNLMSIWFSGFGEMRRLVESPVPWLARSLSPVANPFHFSFALNASAAATRCGLWQPVVYGSACSYRICDKIFYVQWNKGNYYISRMTVNKISVWIWRWRVWKVKKVRKTTATYQTARRTGSTTKVNRYWYHFFIYFFPCELSHSLILEFKYSIRQACRLYLNFFNCSASLVLSNIAG